MKVFCKLHRLPESCPLIQKTSFKECAGCGNHTPDKPIEIPEQSADTLQAVMARHNLPYISPDVYDSRTIGDSDNDYVVKRWGVSAEKEKYYDKIVILLCIQVDVHGSTEDDCFTEECVAYEIPYALADMDKIIKNVHKLDIWQI